MTRGAGRRHGVNLQLRLSGRELLPLALPSRLPWQLCLHGKGIPSPPRRTPVVGATQVRRSRVLTFSPTFAVKRGGRRKQAPTSRGALRCNVLPLARAAPRSCGGSFRRSHRGSGWPACGFDFYFIFFGCAWNGFEGIVLMNCWFSCRENKGNLGPSRKSKYRGCRFREKKYAFLIVRCKAADAP